MNDSMMDLGAYIMIAALKQKKVMNKIIHDAGYNIELAHLKILMAAVHFPNKLYAKDLVVIEGKSKSTINALLSKLEKEEYIILEVDDKDKRAKVITATQKGRKVDKQLSSKLQELVRTSFMKDIPQDEAEHVMATLKKWITNIDAHIGEEHLDYVNLVVKTPKNIH